MQLKRSDCSGVPSSGAVDVTLARERENERHLDIAQLRYLELSGTAYRRRVA